MKLFLRSLRKRDVARRGPVCIPGPPSQDLDRITHDRSLRRGAEATSMAPVIAIRTEICIGSTRDLIRTEHLIFYEGPPKSEPPQISTIDRVLYRRRISSRCSLAAAILVFNLCTRPQSSALLASSCCTK